LNGTYTNGTTEVYFSRKLDTGDKYDFVISENITTDYIWGYYPSTSYVDHQNNYGSGSLNFALTQADLLLNSGSNTYSDEYENHGMAMTVIWMGLMPLSIILARYFKWTWIWFIGHLILGSITIAITFISVSETYDDNEAIYATLTKKKLFHSRLGFSVVSLVLGQGVFGMFLRYINKKTITPYKLAVMRDVHFFTGWTLTIIAFIEIYYGWDLYDSNGDALPIVYFFYAFIAFLFAILELWRRFWYLCPSLGCRKSKVHMTHEEVMKEVLKNNKHYAFCDELVISVGAFSDSHPGGAKLITDSYGEDLGKYLNGCSSYGKGSLPYYHSQGARLMLERLSIGVLSYPDNFLVGKTRQPNYDQMTWKLVSKQDLGATTKQLSYVHEDFYVTKPKGVSWIGKHFRISKKEKLSTVHRYYSISYCMSPSVVHEWRSQIQHAGFEVKPAPIPLEALPEYNEQVNTQDNVLTMIIKEYKPHGIISQFTCGMELGKTISLKGPLGPGLALTEESSGVHLGFAGGTGLVPFLDLVHLIWKAETNQETTGLNPGFSLVLYVSFSTWADSFGIDLLKATHALCQQNNTKRFILHLFINETTEQGRMTPEALREYVSVDKITTAWACGPSPFNRWVCDMLVKEGLERPKVILL
jgi:NAD(P)H-flavin reductase